MTTQLGTLVQLTLTAAILTIAINSDKAEAGDLQNIQVNVNSRFAYVEDHFLQDIGVDFRGLGSHYGHGYGFDPELDALNAAEAGSRQAGRNILRARQEDQYNYGYNQGNGTYGNQHRCSNCGQPTTSVQQQLVRAMQESQTRDGNNGAYNQGQYPGLYNLPELNTQQIRTQVTMPDGGTLIIGGQQHGRQQPENKVPFFTDLPLVGDLFKHHHVDNQDLLILVTPHTIINEE